MPRIAAAMSALLLTATFQLAKAEPPKTMTLVVPVAKALQLVDAEELNPDISLNWGTQNSLKLSRRMGRDITSNYEYRVNVTPPETTCAQTLLRVLGQLQDEATERRANVIFNIASRAGKEELDSTESFLCLIDSRKTTVELVARFGKSAGDLK